MIIIESKIINLNDVVIGNYLIRPIEEMKDNEDLKNLANSIETKGQLHPCFVRTNSNNKYELIAGGRRYAAMRYSNHLTMEAKIVEATNLECMELALTENLHRKKDDKRIEDMQIYDAWKEGLKTSVYKQERDLAKNISLPEKRVKNVIYSGNIKELPIYKNSTVIQNASTAEIVATKVLDSYPAAREQVLAKVQQKGILMKDIATVCNGIKISLDTGAKEEHVKKAIANDVSKSISEPTTLTPEKLNDVLEVVKTAPKDVVEQLVDGKISVEHAKVAKDFDTVEARAQVIKEAQKKEEKKNVTQDVAQHLYEKGVQEHIETRKKQEQEMKIKGETSLKTKLDIERQRKLDEEANKDNIHDQKFIDRYQRLADYTLETLSHFHPKLLRTEDGKRYGKKVMRNLYHLYHNVLVEMGDLKEVKYNGKETGKDYEKDVEKENYNSTKYLITANI